MKWIHIADVHLGAAPEISGAKSTGRQQEIWDSFRKVIEKAKSEQVELLLIAGDLFHRQPLKSELKEVNYLFASIPDTQIVLCAGNHDYLKDNSYYRTFSWSDNVTFFKEEKLEKAELKALGVSVYGLSYEHRMIREALYDSVEPSEDTRIHILLAHGGDPEHIPVKFSQLEKAGFDYVALGHIHKPQILYKDKMAYAGALEPLDKNDTGEHGYMKGEYKDGQMRAWFVPFARRSYLWVEIQSTEEMTQSELEAKIREEIAASGEENYYVISIVGVRESDLVYQTDRIRRLGNIVEVEDYTEPALDYELLHRQYEGTIVGKYIEQFAKPADSIQEKALEYGVAALLQAKR